MVELIGEVGRFLVLVLIYVPLVKLLGWLYDLLHGKDYNK